MCWLSLRKSIFEFPLDVKFRIFFFRICNSKIQFWIALLANVMVLYRNAVSNVVWRALIADCSHLPNKVVSKQITISYHKLHISPLQLVATDLMDTYIAHRQVGRSSAEAQQASPNRLMPLNIIETLLSWPKTHNSSVRPVFIFSMPTFSVSSDFNKAAPGHPSCFSHSCWG